MACRLICAECACVIALVSERRGDTERIGMCARCERLLESEFITGSGFAPMMPARERGRKKSGADRAERKIA